jgi:hypothetical protein
MTATASTFTGIRACSEMVRRSAICRGTGREGSGHVDGHVVREIGQSKVIEHLFEQVGDLTARADIKWHD